jgi:hypothetical protein
MSTPFFTALTLDRTLIAAPRRIYGYYVFCRNRHYILQAYNNGGYDERWESSNWEEINIETLEPYDFETFLNK